MGGTHCQHIFDRPQVHIAHQNRETRHDAFLVPGTLLASLFPGQRKVLVNSTHHQAVETLAPCFTLAATQWHPERLIGENMMPIFTWFIEKCAAVRDE